MVKSFWGSNVSRQLSMCVKWSMRESKNAKHAKNALSHYHKKAHSNVIYAKNCDFDNYASAIYYRDYMILQKIVTNRDFSLENRINSQFLLHFLHKNHDFS